MSWLYYIIVVLSPLFYSYIITDIGYLVFSKEKIGNPTIDEADLVLKFADVKKDVKGKEVIDFKYDGEFRINMVGLGVLLKKLNVNVSDEELNSLIKKDTERNVAGIKYGYSMS